MKSTETHNQKSAQTPQTDKSSAAKLTSAKSDSARGKVAWITGCASGVGLHLADAFHRRGYRVVATDINMMALLSCAKERDWDGETVLIRSLDVRDSQSWEALEQEVLGRWGRIDILINNAGYLRPGFLQETEAEEVELHVDINLKGVIHGSRIGARHMSKLGAGHIINIASLAGVAPIRGLGLYSTAKFGVRAFSLILAQELAPLGVAVSVICPDLIKTAMLDKQLDYQKEAALTFSGGKPLTVEDIERTIFDVVLVKRPLEVLLPRSRGWMAKLANLFPGLSGSLADYFSKRGEKNLVKAREQARRGRSI